VINYYVKQLPDSAAATIKIFDANKELVRTFSPRAKEARDKVEMEPGMNRFVWNLYYPASESIEGMVLWNGVPHGILAAPGNYTARIIAGKDSAEVPFVVKPDPTYKTTLAEYQQQFAFLKEMQNKFDEMQKAIKDIRALRGQINAFVQLQGTEVPKEIKQAADSINKKLTSVEETLYQTKSKSAQDVLNFPIRLNDKLAGLYSVVNTGYIAPSKQARAVYADLSAQINAQLNRLKQVKEKDIPEFNQLIRKNALPVIGVK
jgi:hypothetical protein